MERLTLEQRYKIETLQQEGYGYAQIAQKLNKHKSVIHRELKRNSDQRNGQYKAALAQKKSEERQVGKRKKTYFTQEIEEYVNHWLSEKHSPEQIAGYAKREGIKCVSHERIYQHIWRDKKLKGTLYEHLRSQGKAYRKTGAAKDKRGQIVGRVGIEQRPKVVEEKTRLGDFEIDLVIGKDHQGALLTINDRATGELRMKKIDNKEAENVHQAVIYLLQNNPYKIHTITSDNGKEFAKHFDISTALEVEYYFAKPYRSCERGANENLNGLVRQYFPKKSDFALITNEQVKEVETKLNNRPRKRYGYQSPNEVSFAAMKNNNIVALVD
jgi:IS30 family transposase